MYSCSRSCSAWRTALHSATMRSRRSSLQHEGGERRPGWGQGDWGGGPHLVHELSAMSAAPEMMDSSLSSSEGRVRSSEYCKGSMTIRS